MEIYIWPDELYQWFNSKYQIGKQEECWKWNGSANNCGYGFVCKVINNKRLVTSASRLMFQLFHKVKLDKKELVCHTCDNPICINPNHLFKGSQTDNMKDMVLKGRASNPTLGFIELKCNGCNKLFKRKVAKHNDRIKNSKSGKIYCTQKCSLVDTSIAVQYNSDATKYNGEIRHGTKVAYGYHKCRCDLCKEEHRKRHQEYRQSKKIKVARELT